MLDGELMMSKQVPEHAEKAEQHLFRGNKPHPGEGGETASPSLGSASPATDKERKSREEEAREIPMTLFVEAVLDCCSSSADSS